MLSRYNLQKLLPLAAIFVFGNSLICFAFDKPEPTNELASGEISKLKPFIGNWEVTTEWANGQTLWARNEYRVGLGGKFVEADTYAKDGNGKPYHRYRTIFTYDESKKKFVSYGFTNDGTVQVVENDVEDIDGKIALTSSWAAGKTEIKQTVREMSDKQFGWKVWMRPADGESDWNQSMDAKWERVE